MYSMAVQSPTFLPSHAQETGRKAEPSPSLGTRIKNILFGRVCIDWKDYLIVAFVVINVAKAAVSFFTGHWMMAMIELLTGGFLAKMRKDYREFTDLHAATGEYRKENDLHRNNNLMQAQQIARFKAELGHLTEVREKLGAENKQFALSNHRYKTHLGTMEETLDTAVAKIESAHKRGRTVSTKFLRETLKSFDAQKKMLETMEEELFAKKDAALEEWGKVVETVGEMNLHSVEVLSDAKKQLEATRRDVASETAKLKQIASEVDRMKLENDRLAAIRKDIEGATAQNVASANQIRGALGGLATRWFGSGKQAPGVLDTLQRTAAATTA